MARTVFSNVSYLLAFLYFFSGTYALSIPSLPLKHLEKRVPAVSYGLGGLSVSAAGTPFVALDNGVDFYFQNSDAHFVCYVNGVAEWWTPVVEAGGCGAPNVCEMYFQTDGNFVIYYNGAAIWNTQTGANIGHTLVFYDVEPFIVIYNSANAAVWHTPLPSGGGGGGGGGDGGCDDDCCDDDCCDDDCDGDGGDGGDDGGDGDDGDDGGD